MLILLKYQIQQLVVKLVLSCTRQIASEHSSKIATLALHEQTHASLSANVIKLGAISIVLQKFPPLFDQVAQQVEDYQGPIRVFNMKKTNTFEDL